MEELCFLSNLTSSEWAAWVEALGTLFAILASAGIAICIFKAESTRTRAERKQALDEEAKNIASALYQELANRVARCCFDYELPWQDRLRDDNRQSDRLRKFYPSPPVIYPSVGASIALLDRKAIQRIIDFYVRLDIWGRDLENIADSIPANSGAPERQIALLASRLQRTLKPGLDAIQALATSVENAEAIGNEAIWDLDNTPDIPRHEEYGKPLLYRLEKLLR